MWAARQETVRLDTARLATTVQIRNTKAVRHGITTTAVLPEAAARLQGRTLPDHQVVEATAAAEGLAVAAEDKNNHFYTYLCFDNS